MTAVGRRRLLVGSAGVLGAAGAVGAGLALAGEGPAPPPQRVPTALRADAATDAVSSVEWVRSAARGRSVRLVLVAPPGADRRTLPVCAGLHGLGGNATWWSDPGTRRTLGAAWAAGTPPYVIAALDGGDNYWHPFRAADDPMRMLLDELPGWLVARGVGTAAAGVPALVSGVSMGGAGSLMYARERVHRGAPVRAVAALSPGLFTDWRVARRRPFAGEADWAANDPLRFAGELAGVPLGVWCGDRDTFVDATRRFMAIARPEVASVGPGRHDGAYYARVLPQVVRFLGDHLRAAAPSRPAVPTG